MISCMKMKTSSLVNKPAGMPVHPSLNNYRNSLANALMYYYQQQGKPFIFRCTNRLDRDTSGLTVIAKHMVSSSILSAMTARHDIKREYLAIVRGCVTPASGTVNAPIGRTGSSLIERKIDFENGGAGSDSLSCRRREKRAQPGFPDPGDRAYPPDPCPYAIYRIPPHRRLPVQSGYGVYTASGTALVLPLISASHHWEGFKIYGRAPGGYAKNIPKKLLTLLMLSYIIILAVNKTAYYVRLAQLDRASGYGPEGREFESSIARRKDISVSEMSFFIFLSDGAFSCISRLLLLIFNLYCST